MFVQNFACAGGVCKLKEVISWQEGNESGPQAKSLQRVTPSSTWQGTRNQKFSPPCRVSLEIPEEFWTHHSHCWPRHQEREPSAPPALPSQQREDPELPRDLLCPGGALWEPFSLLKHWCSCSGSGSFLCGLKTAKCAFVSVILCLAQQHCPRGVWEAQRKLSHCSHTERGVSSTPATGANKYQISNGFLW